VYNAANCKVMTIAVCEMQSEDTKVQCIMWREHNKLMRENSVERPNFKGFRRAVRKPAGMPSKSSMEVVTQRSLWRTESTLASSIRLHR
jgi:hypothetical protein